MKKLILTFLVLTSFENAYATDTTVEVFNIGAAIWSAGHMPTINELVLGKKKFVLLSKVVQEQELGINGAAVGEVKYAVYVADEIQNSNLDETLKFSLIRQPTDYPVLNVEVNFGPLANVKLKSEVVLSSGSAIAKFNQSTPQMDNMSTKKCRMIQNQPQRLVCQNVQSVYLVNSHSGLVTTSYDVYVLR